MSLINDALKKAEKQRTGDAPSLKEMPALGGQSAARIARRGKPAGFETMVTRIGIGLGAVVIIVGVTVFFLRRSPEAPAAAKPAPVVAASSNPPVAAPTAAPKPVEVAPIAVAHTPAVSTPVVSAPVVIAPAQPKIEPVAPKVEPAPSVVVAAVASAPVINVAPVETPKPASLKIEPRAITYIEGIRVAGIRASGSDRKVLMNDRVYRTGDLVEPEMGLTLVGIAPNALTFQDEKGRKYTRNF